MPTFLRAVLAGTSKRMWISSSLILVQSMALWLSQYSESLSEKRDNIYNILWVLVFGFATLNILGLVTRKLEPRRSNLNFGEMLAITVVLLSVFLLGWEMLYLFHVLPFKLEPR